MKLLAFVTLIENSIIEDLKANVDIIQKGVNYHDN